MSDLFGIIFCVLIIYLSYKKIFLPLRNKEIQLYDEKILQVKTQIEYEIILKKYLEYLIDEKNTKCKEYLESIDFD